MMRATLVLGAALVPALGGCATYASLEGNEANKVYGGARLDATLISEGLSPDSTPAQSKKVERGMLVCEAWCGMVDMPFSAVADTVLLPVTVPLALTRSGTESPGTAQAVPKKPASPTYAYGEEE
jgi:uncharacterized protein YceK